MVDLITRQVVPFMSLAIMEMIKIKLLKIRLTTSNLTCWIKYKRVTNNPQIKIEIKYLNGAISKNTRVLITILTILQNYNLHLMGMRLLKLKLLIPIIISFLIQSFKHQFQAFNFVEWMMITAISKITLIQLFLMETKNNRLSSATQNLKHQIMWT